MGPGEPTARLHEAGVPLGDGQAQSGRHDATTAAGGEQHVGCRTQIDAGVAGLGVGGHLEVGAHPHNGNLEHGSEL